MNKLVKVSLIIVAVICALLLTGKWYIENNFMRMLNSGESRKFELQYKDISVDFTLNGVTLRDITIIPADTATGNESVYGTVAMATMEGLDIPAFLFSDRLRIDRLRFDRPSFVIYLKNDSSRNQRTREGMEEILGAIIERALLKNFEINDGELHVFETSPDSTLYGSVEKIHVNADNIRTDSVRINFIIPFHVGNLETRLENVEYQVDEHRKMKIESFDFRSENRQLRIEHASMELDTSWLAVSSSMEYHMDIIEFSIRSLTLNNVYMYNIFGETFNLYASSIRVDSLRLLDHRNKNLPDPPDTEKPMFKSMIDYIDIPIDVDSIIVENSYVSYTEMPSGGSSPGTIEFSNIHGYIENVTSDSLQQLELEQFHAHLDARINGQAPLSFDLVVPYSDEHFYLDTRIEPFDMTILNPTLTPLASLKVESGSVNAFRLRMSANRVQSENILDMDYGNLELSVIKGEKGDKETNGLLSGLANVLVRKNNDPALNKFSTINYTTRRNINRGPFNYMWISIRDGVRELVLTGAGAALLPKNEPQGEE